MDDCDDCCAWRLIGRKVPNQNYQKGCEEMHVMIIWINMKLILNCRINHPIENISKMPSGFELRAPALIHAEWVCSACSRITIMATDEGDCRSCCTDLNRILFLSSATIKHGSSIPKNC